MGYNLIIGQAFVDIDLEYMEASISVEGVHNPKAPAFGEPTDYTNERWPSYSVWAEFSRHVGLYDLFFCEEKGLMRNHPFVCPLTKEHLNRVQEALNEKKDIVTTNRNRLIWLEYWIKWAIENCDKPVFKNT